MAVSATDETVARKQVATVYLVLAYNPDSSLDIVETAAKIGEYAQDANDGDLLHAEAMLISQAHALQAMFVNLAERANQQTGVAQLQTLTGLALKAQSQCRATRQTLVDVKYPRQATFIRQTNIAGQQQVNNGTIKPDDAALSRERDRFYQTNFWRHSMANGWTAERRKRQSAMIRNWQPWAKSTGPKTAEGKQRASSNAVKDGLRSRRWADELAAIRECLNGMRVDGRKSK